MFIIGRLLPLEIILALGLQTVRHSSSFTFYERSGAIAFLSDGNHHRVACVQGRPTTTRNYGTILRSIDSTIAKQELHVEISMHRSSQLIKYEANNDVTVDRKFVSAHKTSGGAWLERFQQLRVFKESHGHTKVPKRYRSNPSLANWVGKQRQLYHNFQAGTKPCSLTQKRVDLLNQLNFCWNASSSMRRNGDFMEQDTVTDIEWWSRYEELCKHCQNHDDIHTILRQSRLGVWLDRQRKNYGIQKESAHMKTHNENVTNLDNAQWLSFEKLSALSQISEVWWMARRQWQWETRYRELQQFASTYGHCCVPISYSENTHLAHWVSNQRKLYNLRNAGKRSELTTTRIQKLEDIGFAWNRWDYEFTKKQANQVRNESY